MARVQTLVGVGLALATAGCGSTSSGKVARPQTANLGWHENCGTRTDPLPISTRRLVVGKGVWRVDLSFQNRTRVTLFIQRPHFPGGTYIGLEPFKTSSRREVLERAASGAGAKPRTIAERFDPPLPRRLTPGRAGPVSSALEPRSRRAFRSVSSSGASSLWDECPRTSSVDSSASRSAPSA